MVSYKRGRRGRDVGKLCKFLGVEEICRDSRARREFYFSAHERTGATLAVLAKITARSHVAVMLAIEEAKKDRHGRK